MTRHLTTTHREKVGTKAEEVDEAADEAAAGECSDSIDGRDETFTSEEVPATTNELLSANAAEVGEVNDEVAGEWDRADEPTDRGKTPLATDDDSEGAVTNMDVA